MLRLTAIGNLGGDATVNNVGGEDVVNFNVAVTKRWKNKEGEKKERTNWVSCSYWGKAALAPYLKKGAKILVEGEPAVRTYKSREGDVVPQQDLTVTMLVLLDKKADDSTDGTSGQNSDQAAGEGAPPAGEKKDDLPF